MYSNTITYSNEDIEACIRHCDEQWDTLKQDLRDGKRIPDAEAILSQIHDRRERLILEMKRRHGE